MGLFDSLKKVAGNIKTAVSAVVDTSESEQKKLEAEQKRLEAEQKRLEMVKFSEKQKAYMEILSPFVNTLDPYCYSSYSGNASNRISVDCAKRVIAHFLEEEIDESALDDLINGDKKPGTNSSLFARMESESYKFTPGKILDRIDPALCIELWSPGLMEQVYSAIDYAVERATKYKDCILDDEAYDLLQKFEPRIKTCIKKVVSREVEKRLFNNDEALCLYFVTRRNLILGSFIHEEMTDEEKLVLHMGFARRISNYASHGAEQDSKEVSKQEWSAMAKAIFKKDLEGLSPEGHEKLLSNRVRELSRTPYDWLVFEDVYCSDKTYEMLLYRSFVHVFLEDNYESDFNFNETEKIFKMISDAYIQYKISKTFKA